MKIKKEFKINPFSTKKLKFMAALFVCFSLLAIAMVPITQKGLDATQNTDTTSYVMVDEIWNAEEGYFNANTLSSLLQYITNNASITSSDITTAGSIGQTKSSADIRASTANGKTTSQDVQVTFGGLTWQVVYLTQDTNGNDIVTLWLSNNYQQAWEGRSATEGTYYGFIDGALYSDWSYNFQNASFTVTYPSSLYGASYIHAVTLNNGGTYATSTSAVTSQPAQQDSNSVFAIYTMDSVAGSVTKYLVTPSEVAYQETENANTQFGLSYYYPNEAYGEPNGSGSWSPSGGGAVNITTNQYYDAWADDTLWLPSLTETGYSTGYEGLWDTSTAQRVSNTGNDLSANMGTVGTASDTAYNRSWLRSGYGTSAEYAYSLVASGSGGDRYGVGNSFAVRPALHLNLTAAAKNAVAVTSPTWDGSTTAAPSLQNPSASNSETNPYIIDTAAKLAWISANFDQSNCYGQHYLQTVDIDLNNHPWTPINNANTSRAYYYDGGNHTVSNLYINTSEQTLTSNNYLGLFGYVWGSSSNHCYVKNLGIVNGSIAGEGSRCVGAVVGEASYTDITNCYNEKTDITITGSSYYVGGVVGYKNSGTISGSYNTGIVSGYRNVGGVVGVNFSGTISGSYNTGSVSGERYVGGVAGYVEGSSSRKALISSCFSTGAIIRSSGSNTTFGGVVGYIYNDTYNPSRYVSISWCYYNTETVGGVVTKAIGEGNGYQVYGLTTAQMQGDKNQNYMYLSDTVWNFASGSYPTLKYVATVQN